MRPEVKISGVGVVLLGSFAPTIFHPRWFEETKLMASQEAQDAKIEIIHSDVTNFQANWLALTVTPERFSAGTEKDESIPLLRDLVLGVLQFFPKTPIPALGINRHFHFKMPDSGAWHDLGHRFAPKEPWKGVLDSPGMMGVNMQGQRRDGHKGNINITVQPSVKIQTGVFVQINDHYQLDGGKAGMFANDAMKIFQDIWQPSLDYSEATAYTLVST